MIRGLLAFTLATLSCSHGAEVFAWGYSNPSGSIGNGATSPQPVIYPSPIAVDASGLLSGKSIARVSAGGDHFAAVATTGELFSWGYNGWGQLGDGTVTDRNVPVAVDTSGVLNGLRIIQLACGGNFTLALSAEGQVFAWGKNDHGQLGDGTIDHRNSPVAVTGIPLNKTVTKITAGLEHSYALTADGKLYGWGGNGFFGILGIGTSDPQSSTAIEVNVDGKAVADVAAGHYHSLALANDGSLYTWGGNDYGVLGNGTMVPSAFERSPVPVVQSGALAGQQIVAVSAGFVTCYAISANGHAFSWGLNTSGQLGDGTTENRTTPVAVDRAGVLAGKEVAFINGGQRFTLAVTTDSNVYTWGDDSSGQLGDGAFTPSSSPLPGPIDTSGVLAGRTLLRAACGFTNGLVIASPAPAVPVFPRGGIDRVSEGEGFRIWFRGIAGQPYLIRYSQDLKAPWHDLSSPVEADSNGIYEVVDPSPPSGSRFYQGFPAP